MSRRFAFVFSLAFIVAACFRGDEREKDPPPGLPGGKCLAPDGTCEVGECNRERNYCYLPSDPCYGFFCGGSERGLCTANADLQPRCICRPGFNNDLWTHYCCPDEPSGDLNCKGSEEPMPTTGGSTMGGSTTSSFTTSGATMDGGTTSDAVTAGSSSRGSDTSGSTDTSSGMTAGAIR